VAAYLNSLRAASPRHRLSLRLMAAAERRFYRRYQGQVIAISQKVARELRDFYQVQGSISVIPHGVDHGRFNSDDRLSHRDSLRSELGIDQDSIVALYVGDLTKSHTHVKAVAAAAPEVQFIIVTSSRQYHWHARNVRILPSTSHLDRYYAMADAFIFPTSYDAFGMVILEAMAAGLPVFSSECAGAAELIRSGTDGFVIPLADWVEVTVAALSNRDALQAVGREAEKTAQQHPWSAVVQEVEKVYFQISAK